MKRLKNIHPGQILKEEFLALLNITAYRLAKETGIPQTRISQILQYKRSVSADTAIRFSKFFGTSPQFWLGLQNDFDLEEEMLKKKKEFNEIQNYKDFFLLISDTDSYKVHKPRKVKKRYPSYAT
jgi:addiction module HigA family antidote